MGAMASQTPAYWLFTQPFVQTQIRSNKASQLRVTGLGQGISPVHSPNKEPVTRKMFPFDGVIM